jgi:hypothetical protein
MLIPRPVNSITPVSAISIYVIETWTAIGCKKTNGRRAKNDGKTMSDRALTLRIRSVKGRGRIPWIEVVGHRSPRTEEINGTIPTILIQDNPRSVIAIARIVELLVRRLLFTLVGLSRTSVVIALTLTAGVDEEKILVIVAFWRLTADPWINR